MVVIGQCHRGACRVDPLRTWFSPFSNWGATATSKLRDRGTPISQIQPSDGSASGLRRLMFGFNHRDDAIARDVLKFDLLAGQPGHRQLIDFGGGPAAEVQLRVAC